MYFIVFRVVVVVVVVIVVAIIVVAVVVAAFVVVAIVVVVAAAVVSSDQGYTVAVVLGGTPILNTEYSLLSRVSPKRDRVRQARSAVRCSASRMKGELHPILRTSCEAQTGRGVRESERPLRIGKPPHPLLFPLETCFVGAASQTTQWRRCLSHKRLRF